MKGLIVGYGTFVLFFDNRSTCFGRPLNFSLLFLHSRDSFPMLLVGNKADLDNERQVSAAEAKDLARKFGVSFNEESKGVQAKYKFNLEGEKRGKFLV